MHTPPSTATDYSDDNDLSLSQVVGIRLSQDQRRNNVSTIPLTSAYEFEERCLQSGRYNDSDQAAKELLMEYDKKMKQVESIVERGIVKNEDNAAWQALGRFGTLSGFADIALTLAQMLAEQEKLHGSSMPLSSVPLSQSGRKEKNDHTLSSGVSKPKKESTSNHRADRKRKPSQKIDRKALASMIRPCLPDEEERISLGTKDGPA